jgi:hypothetical protein
MDGPSEIPRGPGGQLPQNFTEEPEDGGEVCDGGEDGQVCNAVCPGLSAASPSPLKATCERGMWAFTGEASDCANPELQTSQAAAADSV